MIHNRAIIFSLISISEPLALSSLFSHKKEIRPINFATKVNAIKWDSKRVSKGSEKESKHLKWWLQFISMGTKRDCSCPFSILPINWFTFLSVFLSWNVLRLEYGLVMNCDVGLFIYFQFTSMTRLPMKWCIDNNFIGRIKEQTDLWFDD